MSKLGVVEDTLFVPMLGRIYASEHYPQILYDKKALELKKKLPSDLIKRNMQSQYTLLASASRSANMDRIIRTFLERRPDGVIVQLGCGLETTYHRCDKFDISTSALKQCFKGVYGTAIYTYMRNYRMDLAASLLTQTDEPITVIAGKVGYTNTSKFSEAFKKIKGKTPLEYRKIKI